MKHPEKIARRSGGQAVFQGQWGKPSLQVGKAGCIKQFLCLWLHGWVRLSGFENLGQITSLFILIIVLLDKLSP